MTNPGPELLRDMIESIPQLVWIVHPDGKLEFVNNKWREFTGLTFEELERGEWDRIVHPDDRIRLRDAWTTALEEGIGFEFEARFLNHQDGAYYWHLNRAQPLRDPEGNIVRWFGSSTDIDRAKRAEERLRFLNRAGEILSSSLNYEDTLRRMVEAAVPEIADWCAIDMVQQDGSIRRLAVAHVDPEKVELANQLFEHYPPHKDDPGGTYAILRTGKPQIYPSLPKDLLRTLARDERHYELIESLGLESAMAVPISIEDRPVGVLTMVSSESHRHFNEQDLEFAEELARTGASAIRNAQLFEAASHEIGERKRIEADLRKSEADFRILLESNLIGIIFGRSDGSIYYANQSFLDLIGYSREEVQAGKVHRQDISLPEELHVYFEVLKQLDREGYAPPYEKRFVTKDGRIVNALLSTAYLGSGRDTVVSFVLDLTEVRAAEAARRELELQYQLIAETVNDAIISIDESSHILFANRAASRIFGHATEDLIGQSLDLIIPDYMRELHHQGVERYVRTGKRHLDWTGLELSALHKSGHEFPVDVSFGEYQRDGERVFVGSVRDISERRRVERQLAISEARFRTMIEQSPLSIQVFSEDGACVKANKAWEMLWLKRPEDVHGYNILEDPQLAKLGMLPYVQRAFKGETVETPPIYYDPIPQVGHGRRRWVRGYLYPINDEYGNLQEVALITEDITAMTEAAEELERARQAAESANAAKDRFLAVLSHELRTPLTPILTTVQALDLDEEVPESLRPWLEIIERNVQLEARLIDDLLDLTRISKGKLPLSRVDVDVHRLLRNVLDIFQSEIHRKRLTLEVAFEAEYHCVHGDPARLQQIFWNLLRNAIKFTPEGGRIIIHTSNAEEYQLRIRFIDTGIGIEPHIVDRIFEPFEQGEQSITRHFGGLGLGLAISKLLAEMHHGTLSASSPGRGKGATFTFTLPSLTVVQLPKSVQPPQKRDRHVQDVRVLMVDDHYDTSLVLRTLLERRGLQTHVAHTVRDALDYAREHEFDVLVSDIGLPDGTGLDLIRELKEKNGDGHFHAIAMSGYGTEQDIRKSHEAGFDNHLIKPFDFQLLYDAIRELVN